MKFLQDTCEIFGRHRSIHILTAVSFSVIDFCHPLPQGPPFCARDISENRTGAQPKSGDFGGLENYGYSDSYGRYSSGTTSRRKVYSESHQVL